MAATQAMFGLFVEPARALGVDPLWVGALVSIGAAAGRTMSPVSAVMLMTGRLTDTSPLDLFRRVAPPLVLGAIVILLLAVFRPPVCAFRETGGRLGGPGMMFSSPGIEFHGPAAGHRCLPRDPLAKSRFSPMSCAIRNVPIGVH
jgi:hypothetical protein